jgi:quercetin dioxygenase-like cupin family protein
LDPGDFLLFEANLPHRWGNPGDDLTRLLLVLQAPDGSVQEPARRHFFEFPSVAHLS